MPASAPALLDSDVRPAPAMPAVTIVDAAPPLVSRPGRPRRLPAVSMVAGALAVLAAAGFAVGRQGDGPARPATPLAAEAPAGPLAITLSGPGDVTVLAQAYEPGKDSGWHAHPGIHAVAVLSGTLTVYDERCQPHTFGPGQSYVGGQEPHLVVNETATPVDMVVTYLNPAGPQNSTRHVATPAECAPTQR